MRNSRICRFIEQEPQFLAFAQLGLQKNKKMPSAGQPATKGLF